MHRPGTVREGCCNLSGQCHCGCGNPAPICARTNKYHREKRGEYRQFIQGHNTYADCVPNDNVRGFYDELYNDLGSWKAVSDKLGIPLSTIESHIYEGRNVSRKHATRIAEVYQGL